MILQFNELSFNDKDFQVNLDIYLKKRSMNSHEVSSTVAEIIDLIRTQGDSGLKKLTYDFELMGPFGHVQGSRNRQLRPPIGSVRTPNTAQSEQGAGVHPLEC